MTNRGHQFKRGLNVYEGKLSICNSGFHACKKLEDIFSYAPDDGWQEIYIVTETKKEK